jgi:hypothetical protein
MKASNVITMALWITPIVVQSIVAILMFHRKLIQIFPAFFTYSVLIPTREILLFVVRKYPNCYSGTYWLSEAIVVALSLGVICEVIWHLIRPYSSLRRYAFRFFWVVAAAALAMALMLFVLAGQSGQPDPLFETIILLERSVRFLQACWLIVLILLMSRLGLTWQYYAAGIAVGFGVYAASDLVLLELRAHLHWIADGTLVILNSTAYNAAVIIWVLYFLRPRLKTGTIVASLPATDISRWNEELTGYLNKWLQPSSSDAR